MTKFKGQFGQLLSATMHSFIYLICSLVLKQPATEKEYISTLKILKFSPTFIYELKSSSETKMLYFYTLLLFKILSPKEVSEWSEMTEMKQLKFLPCSLQAQHVGRSLWTCCLGTEYQQQKAGARG